MKTNEIFEHVLQIVCEECELWFCWGGNGFGGFGNRGGLPAELNGDVIKEERKMYFL